MTFLKTTFISFRVKWSLMIKITMCKVSVRSVLVQDKTIFLTKKQ